MDIHRPKAASSIREFLIEIGTIICGILIALMLEQVVEGWRTHETVETLRAALNRELSYNRARMELLRAPDSCNERDIKEFVAWTRTAPPGAVHPDISIMRLPTHLSAWELARANPAFVHIPIGEQLAYSRAYDALGMVNHFGVEEQTVWREIKGALPFSGDPQVRRHLVPLLTTALGYQRGREMGYRGNFALLDELHIRADYSDVKGLALKQCDLKPAP